MTGARQHTRDAPVEVLNVSEEGVGTYVADAACAHGPNRGRSRSPRCRFHMDAMYEMTASVEFSLARCQEAVGEAKLVPSPLGERRR